MKTFRTDKFRLTVRQGPVSGTWQILVETPKKRAMASTGGEGPEENVAIDLLNQMAEIYNAGVIPVVKKMEEEMPDADPAQLRKTASMLFAVTEEAGGMEALDEMAKEVLGTDLTPGVKEAASEFAKSNLGKYGFGDVEISVQPHSFIANEIVQFYVKFKGPQGAYYEDLMKRPVGYLMAQVAKEQLDIMRSVLAAGVEASAQRFLKANYLGPDYLPAMTKHAQNIERFATVVGDPELARMHAAMDAEIEREVETLDRIKGKMERSAETDALERLERREKELSLQIEELKKLLAKKPDA